MKIKTLFLVLGYVVGWGNASAAQCSLPEYSDKSNEHPECLYFVGTKNFREKNFAAALGSWERLRSMTSVPPEFEDLRVNTYNNLGYLYFMGLGVDANKSRAFEYWKYAFGRGHEESGYHLCHAYGEPDQPEYRPQEALEYCKEALRRYRQSGRPATEDQEEVRQLVRYISRLEAR